MDVTSDRPPAIDEVTAENSSLANVLEDLNTKFALSVLPIFIYLGILLAVGLVGNTLSFVVYWKFRPSSTRTYILALSVLDLSNNVFAYPQSMIELCFRFTFDIPWVCRACRFLKSAQVLASAFVLVAVALDRHSRVCRSLRKQQTAGYALRAVVACGVAGALLSLPYGAVTGRQTIPTGHGNLTGVMCSIDDAHKSSVLLLAYNAATGLAFVTCLTIIAVCYIRIACHVWQHRKCVATLNQSALTHARDASSSGDAGSTPQTQSSTAADMAPLSASTSSGQQATDEDARTNLLTAKAAATKGTVLELARFPDALKQTTPSDALGNEATDVTCPAAEDALYPMTRREEPCSSSKKDLVLRAPGSLNDAGTLAKLGDDREERKEQQPQGTGHRPQGTGQQKQEVLPALQTTSVVSGGDSNTSTGRTADVGRSPSSSCGRSLTTSDTTTGTSRTAAGRFKTTSQKAAHVKEVASRTTLIMFMLTLVFVISFLPYWAVVFLRGALRFSEHGMRPAVFNVYLLALHSFFISSATNAIVYGVFSAQFRHDCRRLLLTCLGRRRH